MLQKYYFLDIHDFWLLSYRKQVYNVMKCQISKNSIVSLLFQNFRTIKVLKVKISWCHSRFYFFLPLKKHKDLLKSHLIK